jgi:hypothetical protein
VSSCLDAKPPKPGVGRVPSPAACPTTYTITSRGRGGGAAAGAVDEEADSHPFADHWTVSDDWPDRVPVTEAEIDLFEAWFGDILDELFGKPG